VNRVLDKAQYTYFDKWWEYRNIQISKTEWESGYYPVSVATKPIWIGILKPEQNLNTINKRRKRWEIPWAHHIIRNGYHIVIAPASLNGKEFSTYQWFTADEAEDHLEEWLSPGDVDVWMVNDEDEDQKGGPYGVIKGVGRIEPIETSFVDAYSNHAVRMMRERGQLYTLQSLEGREILKGDIDRAWELSEKKIPGMDLPKEEYFTRRELEGFSDRWMDVIPELYQQIQEQKWQQEISRMPETSSESPITEVSPSNSPIKTNPSPTLAQNPLGMTT